MLKHISTDEIRAFIRLADAVREARDRLIDRTYHADLGKTLPEQRALNSPESEEAPIESMDVLASTVYADRFAMLRRAIATLPPEARRELHALALIGRADFAAKQWEQACAAAEEAAEADEADAIAETASLAFYLAKGLYEMKLAPSTRAGDGGGAARPGPVSSDGGAARNGEITSFEAMYIAELQELRDAESQLADGLRRMAERAGHPELKNALMQQHECQASHLQQLDHVLATHRAPPDAHRDQAMQALLQEADKMMQLLPSTDLRDAGIIASAQKLEHYLMAALGTGAALAGQLDRRDEQKLLHAALDDERRADALLTALAKQVVNPDALDG